MYISSIHMCLYIKYEFTHVYIHVHIHAFSEQVYLIGYFQMQIDGRPEVLTFS